MRVDQGGALLGREAAAGPSRKCGARNLPLGMTVAGTPRRRRVAGCGSARMRLWRPGPEQLRPRA